VTQFVAHCRVTILICDVLVCIGQWIAGIANALLLILLPLHVVLNSWNKKSPTCLNILHLLDSASLRRSRCAGEVADPSFTGSAWPRFESS
jgi:hypothetical protein